MKEEKNEIAANPLSDSSSREDGKLASDELKNINRYKAYKNELNQKLNISGIGQEKNLNKFDYKSYFLPTFLLIVLLTFIILLFFFGYIFTLFLFSFFFLCSFFYV